MANRYYKIQIKHNTFKTGYRLMAEIIRYKSDSSNLLTQREERFDIPLAIYQGDLCPDNPHAKTTQYVGFYLSAYNNPEHGQMAKNNAIFLAKYKDTSRLCVYLKKGETSTLDFLPYLDQSESIEIFIGLKERYHLMSLLVVNEYGDVVQNSYCNYNETKPNYYSGNGYYGVPSDLENRYDGKLALISLAQDRDGDFYNDEIPDMFTAFPYSSKNKAGIDGNRKLRANIRSIPTVAGMQLELVMTSISGSQVVYPLAWLGRLANYTTRGIGEYKAYRHMPEYKEYAAEIMEASHPLSPQFIQGVSFKHRYANHPSPHKYGYSYLPKDFFTPSQDPKIWEEGMWGVLDDKLFQLNRMHAYQTDLTFDNYTMNFPYLENVDSSDEDVANYKRKETIREIRLRLAAGVIYQETLPVFNMVENDKYESYVGWGRADGGVYDTVYRDEMLCAFKLIDPKKPLMSRYWIDDMHWPNQGNKFNYGDNYVILALWGNPYLRENTGRWKGSDTQQLGLVIKKGNIEEALLNPPTVDTKYGPAYTTSKEYHPYRYENRDIATYNRNNLIKFITSDETGILDSRPINKLMKINQPAHEAMAIIRRDKLKDVVGIYLRYDDNTPGNKNGFIPRSVSSRFLTRGLENCRTYMLSPSNSTGNLYGLSFTYLSAEAAEYQQWVEYHIDCDRISHAHSFHLMELVLRSPDGKEYPIAVRDSVATERQRIYQWRLYGSDDGLTTSFAVRTQYNSTTTHDYKLTITKKQFAPDTRTDVFRFVIEEDNATSQKVSNDYRWVIFLRDRITGISFNEISRIERRYQKAT